MLVAVEGNISNTETQKSEFSNLGKIRLSRLIYRPKGSVLNPLYKCTLGTDARNPI